VRTLRHAASKHCKLRTCLRNAEAKRLLGPVVHPTRRRYLFSAEVPFGPFRTCPLTTEAVAAPLHPHHVAPDKPTVVAPNAREHVVYLREEPSDSQPNRLILVRLSHTFFSARRRHASGRRYQRGGRQRLVGSNCQYAFAASSPRSVMFSASRASRRARSGASAGASSAWLKRGVMCCGQFQSNAARRMMRPRSVFAL
jgi:hypothetical protein